MSRLLLVGLNHTTAPLEVREKLAFSAEQRRIALDAFRARFSDAEAVLVSTCNRVELYVARSVHGHPREEEMTAFLAGFHSLTGGEVAAHLYRKTDLDVVTHLFAVASSLDSLVLGETQILGQVREAYDAARVATSAGPLLHPLFQRAISVGKQVMSQTALTEGRLSVASVAVEYARRIFDHFADKTVLSIGAGKMASLALQSFKALAPGRLLVCNRDPAKAVALAEKFAAQPAPFEKLCEHLVAADVVISSTGSTHPILTRQQFEQVLPRRRYRPVFIIDIALPRDVEASVGDLENVYLYNIDDLQRVVMETHQQRGAAVDAARRIIAREVEEYTTWQRTRHMGPLIDRLYKRYHAVALEEARRTINKLPESATEAQRDQFKSEVEELARRIVNKLLHDPVQGLRASDSVHGPLPQYLHALERLFKLEAEADPSVPPVDHNGQGASHGQAQEG